MKIKIIGKNIAVTAAMEAVVTKKLSRLEKYLNLSENTEARVVARVYPTKQKVEITIPTKIGLLRAEAEHEDFYAAIDLAMEKLERQIRKQKTRITRRHKPSIAETFIEDDSKEDVVVKTKTIIATMMDVEEAIMQMELSGHDFYIYRDDESDTISVVYKRKDGGYGLIETE